MTIPNIIQGYKKQVVETRLKEFYTTMQQAFKLAEVDNGDISNWGQFSYGGPLGDVYHSNSDDWFDKYISPHLKGQEKVDLESYFNDSKILRLLPNGSAFTFNTNEITFFPNAGDFYKCTSYDNSTRVKKCSGTKYFKFLYYPDTKITPFDYPNHSNKLSFTYEYYRNKLRREQLVGSIGSCSKTSVDAGRDATYCAELIMLEGWKIPKDYPFRF